MGGCYSDKGVDGTKTKSKASEDEMFSDAVAEFSEEVRPNKSMGDALDSLSTSKMAVEDEMSSSRTLKDREVLGMFCVGDVLLAIYTRLVSIMILISW